MEDISEESAYKASSEEEDGKEGMGFALMDQTM